MFLKKQHKLETNFNKKAFFTETRQRGITIKKAQQ